MGGMNSGVVGVGSSVIKSDSSQTGTKPKSTVQTLLGEHSNLVNLDDLVTSGKQPGKTHVTFRDSVSPGYGSIPRSKLY